MSCRCHLFTFYLPLPSLSDLKHAINDAYMAITHYGMDKSVQYINVKEQSKEASSQHQVPHSNSKIDEALARWMDESEARTIRLVDEHWEKIEDLAIRLLDREIMYEDELEEIV